MSIHKILHTLLTVAVGGLASSCESNFTGADIDEGQHVGILYCVADAGDDIEVSAYGSASYSDTARYTVIDYATVSIIINGAIRSFATIPAGGTEVAFEGVEHAGGDEMTIMVQSPQLGNELIGTTTIMERTPIERIDTATIDNGSTLRVTTYIRDDKESEDYYRLEFGARTWTDGRAEDVSLRCRYLSSAFTSVGMTMWADESGAGLIDDTRLSTLSNGLSPLNISTQRGYLAPLIWSSDSVGIFVRLSHISADYYSYLQTVSLASASNILPIFTFTSIHSNVAGGLGLVVSATTDEVVMMIDNEEEAVEDEDDAATE